MAVPPTPLGIRLRSQANAQLAFDGEGFGLVFAEGPDGGCRTGGLWWARLDAQGAFIDRPERLLPVEDALGLSLTQLHFWNDAFWVVHSHVVSGRDATFELLRLDREGSLTDRFGLPFGAAYSVIGPRGLLLASLVPSDALVRLALVGPDGVVSRTTELTGFVDAGTRHIAIGAAGEGFVIAAEQVLGMGAASWSRLDVMTLDAEGRPTGPVRRSERLERTGFVTGGPAVVASDEGASVYFALGGASSGRRAVRRLAVNADGTLGPLTNVSPVEDGPLYPRAAAAGEVTGLLWRRREQALVFRALDANGRPTSAPRMLYEGSTWHGCGPALDNPHLIPTGPGGFAFLTPEGDSGQLLFGRLCE
ncbi:MAG: hypothetical protein AAGH15_03560 [Myxococcota bacterium]